MINHERKTIFVHIPKTGGTSISSALQEQKDHYHMTLGDIIRMECNEKSFNKSDLLKFNTYFKFAFVRNPWDRMVSLYTEKAQTGWLNPGVSFTDFICNVYTQPAAISRDPNLRIHSRPCSHWLTIDGEIAVDFVGRFEQLQEDFNTVCEKIGMHSIPLEKLRHRKREHYSSFYNEKTISIVAEYNKKDIGTFSYQFQAPR